MKQISDLYQIAKQFKAEATELMERLCASANISVTDADRNVMLRKYFGKQVEHDLDNIWVFTLHGAECRFTDRRTNRELEVILTNDNNFGVIDFHFFTDYLKQELGAGKDIYIDIDKTEIETQLHQLYDKGLLTKVNSAVPDLDRNVSANCCA